jgi:hypothetical protein
MYKKMFHTFSPTIHKNKLRLFITKDDFQTLVDIVIVNQIRIDLVQRASMMIVHVTTIGAQNKAQSYT